MRPAPPTTDSSSHDSFLDILANLVGILLILIMVVGVRTRDAWKKADSDTTLLSVATPTGLATAEATQQQMEARLEETEQQLKELQNNTFELDRQIKEVEAATAAEKQERDHLQFLVTAAKKALTNVAGTLNEDQAADFGKGQELDAAKDQLATLQQELDAALAIANQSQIIEHHPTPLAKPVFGREEHFRLSGGRIVYVPLNELIEELKIDAENKLWKLQHVNEITETLPPRGGFRLKYTMRRYRRREETDSGPTLRTTVELERFILLTIDDQPGVPLDAAIQDGSQLWQRLAELSPAETTITVWTYPDSFAEFRRLKDYLFQQGFQVAARPLPEGFPIGGSPEGNRSSAE